MVLIHFFEYLPQIFAITALTANPMNKRKRDFSNQLLPEYFLIKSILKPIGRLSLPYLSSTDPASPYPSRHTSNLQSIHAGKLFSSGDIILSLPITSSSSPFPEPSPGSTIHLFKDIISSSHPIQCQLDLNLNQFPSFLISSSNEFPPPSPHHHSTSNTSHFILSSSTGHVIFLLTNSNHRISTIEYDLQMSSNDEEITTIASYQNLILFGTTNNEIYILGRDDTSARVDMLTNTTTRIFCYKLKKLKNIFYDWIETGSRLLGFGWNQDKGGTTNGSTWSPLNSIVKLLPFESKSVSSSLLSSSLLLSLNSTNLSLWELYEHSTLTASSSNTSAIQQHEKVIFPFNIDDDEGNEKLYWEINLQLLLDADLNYQLSSVITNQQLNSSNKLSLASSSSKNSPKIQRKFHFLDLFLLTTYQDSDHSPSPSSFSASSSDSPKKSRNRKYVHVALLSIVYPASSSPSLPRDSYLLHPELWIHILQVDVTNPFQSSQSKVNEINLTSALALQQSVCQMKLRRRIAILNPSTQDSVAAPPSPRFLPGNNSHSLNVAWYDVPRTNSGSHGSTPVASLHCVELTDLHHYTLPSERISQENSPVDGVLNASNSSSDVTAYSDYFLLHDTMGISSLSRSNTANQKSNLCEGIGADTGIMSTSIISYESLRSKHQQNDELNVIRKGLMIITAGTPRSSSLSLNSSFFPFS